MSQTQNNLELDPIKTVLHLMIICQSSHLKICMGRSMTSRVSTVLALYPLRSASELRLTATTLSADGGHFNFFI